MICTEPTSCNAMRSYNRRYDIIIGKNINKIVQVYRITEFIYLFNLGMQTIMVNFMDIEDNRHHSQ